MNLYNKHKEEDGRIILSCLFSYFGEGDEVQMHRCINVGIIQMPIKKDTVKNLYYFEKQVAELMAGFRKPELIIGVEYISNLTPQYIPGPMTEYFGKIAKKYGVYMIPGTICEKNDCLLEGKYYNTAPIFDPNGNLIDIYRKIIPWRPSEKMIEPGDRYVVFDIPEKKTKIGVQICYDLNFPEISRNEVLMGAEVLVKLTLDPMELFRLNRPIHFARAIENQAYLVSTNGVGIFSESTLYGHSMVIDPQGQCLWEAKESPAVGVITLDLDLVKKCREFGSLFIEHYLQNLCAFPPPMPFVGKMQKAPLFQTMKDIRQIQMEDEEKRKGIPLHSVDHQNVNESFRMKIEHHLDIFLNKEK